MVCWELQMHPRWGNVGLGPSDQSLCRVWLKSGDWWDFIVTCCVVTFCYIQRSSTFSAKDIRGYILLKKIVLHIRWSACCLGSFLCKFIVYFWSLQEIPLFFLISLLNLLCSEGSKRWLGHWPAGNAITTQLSPDMTYLDSTYYCFLLEHIMITLLICYLFWLGVGFCSFVVSSHELLRASHFFAIGLWMYQRKESLLLLSCLWEHEVSL